MARRAKRSSTTNEQEKIGEISSKERNEFVSLFLSDAINLNHLGHQSIDRQEGDRLMQKSKISPLLQNLNAFSRLFLYSCVAYLL